MSSKDLNIIGWIIGGILVGVGTKLGNGCTSGHGICGLPRLSIRSWIAVPTFMGFGIAMSTFRYYVDWMYDGTWFGKEYDDNWRILSGFLAIVLFFGCVYLAI